MSIMTGQNPADSGEVTYNGQPVWENAEALSHICFSREINTKSLLGMNNQKVKEYLVLLQYIIRTGTRIWQRNL